MLCDAAAFWVRHMWGRPPCDAKREPPAAAAAGVNRAAPDFLGIKTERSYVRWSAAADAAARRPLLPPPAIAGVSPLGWTAGLLRR
jgi:hypothetical protein